MAVIAEVPQRKAPTRLLLASPRGYCAGVERAIETVELALDRFGPPVYVRKEIVHNRHVVERLRERGAIFVDDETDVPEGEIVIFSAHGVAPSVRERAAERGLRQIDSTCPLVTKVHVEVKRFAAAGYTVVEVGHAGHEEVEGAMGEAPDATVLVETVEDVDRLEVRDPDRVAYVTQTTLSVDDTRAVIARLRERFPSIVGPRTDDICYATTNRQDAVKAMARQCDLVLVVGAPNSSNSNRLVDVARDHGAEAHLIGDAGAIREEWLAGRSTIGVTSGASVPEDLVQGVLEFLQARGAGQAEEVRVADETVRFMLPPEVRPTRRRDP
jgi:4-hydroxy-3-methylbut-2-enyl diphosphate reductase